ncbi:hypothetical protein NM688_g6464 [Phlebia brevispora]|uniref:Uncharacterized protein n=1 Tax=Phlebia brevispora TaxID=194682 RepID=A0ACC1SFW7_9APHY|nr:hypothetical protein NM688_g6464 [Phlebia brevispora]
MDLASVRLPLYVALWLFSFLLFCFTAARLHYTLNLSKNDPLNGGVRFYDPIVVELLVCSLLALGAAPFVYVFMIIPKSNALKKPSLISLHLVHRVVSHPWLEFPRSMVEPIALSILSFLWIVGCGDSSAIWGNLSWCSEFQPCRILSAMIAFAWLGWVCILGLQLLYLIAWVQARRGMMAGNLGTASYPPMRERDLPVPSSPTSQV